MFAQTDKHMILSLHKTGQTQFTLNEHITDYEQAQFVVRWGYVAHALRQPLTER